MQTRLGSGGQRAAGGCKAAQLGTLRASLPRLLRAPPLAAAAPGADSASGSGGGKQGQQQEEPLWWVQKFEERKRREQEAAAARRGGGRGAGGDSSGDAPPPAALEAAAAAAADSGQQQQQQQQQQHQRPPPPGTRRAAGRQCALLAVGLAALILAPAALQDEILHPRPWLLFAAYFAFFAGGSVRRVLAHGPLAPAAADKQRRDAASRAALGAFILSMPIIHWLPLRRYLLIASASPFSPMGAAVGVSLYDILGFGLMAAAAALNWRAAAALGAAYDRVVAPQRLVTSGPYSLVQHPIYGSYTLLFAGYCLACHSAPFAILAIWICALYYKRRAALESEVLAGAFGEQYERYKAATPKLFVPWVA